MLNSKKRVTLILLPVFFLFVSDFVYAGNKSHHEPRKNAVSENIVFSSHISGSWQIWSINPEGNNLSQITHSALDVHYPAWSPDANKLAYANNEGEIWIMEPGKSPEKIPTTSLKCSYPSWSPDGSKIAFVSFSFTNGREESDIWISELKEKKVYRLLEIPGIQKDPDWSPNGNSIAYTTGYWTPQGELREELWIVDMESKANRPLIVNDDCNIHPSWSPDGEWIAFASDRTGNMEIWVIDKDGKNAKQLTRHRAYDADPCWSPDGSRLCFVSTRGGKLDIWVMDKDGGNERQVTNVSQADCKEPFWR